MIKTITFNGNEVTINDSTGWLYDYREQFGEDFLATVYPVIIGLVETISDVQGANGNIDADAAVNLAINSAGLRSTMLSDILWAMAHNADKQIPPPREWANQFDGFPVDEIGIPLLESVLQSFMSKKKVTKIMAQMKKVGLSISTSLQSQESTEDLIRKPSAE